MSLVKMKLTQKLRARMMHLNLEVQLCMCLKFYKFSDIFKKICKPRRRKSETLRAQYINTKDVRVTIGTWNVAGRPPHEDLEIDEWLCMEEPADVYILGSSYNFVAQPDCLKIPAEEFVGSVKTTIDIVRQVTSAVFGFTRAFGNFRLTNAISDCLDLLELSTDELSSTLFVTQNPHNGHHFVTDS